VTNATAKVTCFCPVQCRITYHHGRAYTTKRMRETTNILWLTPLSHVTCSIPLKDVLRVLNKGIPSEEQHDAVQWKRPHKVSQLCCNQPSLHESQWTVEHPPLQELPCSYCKHLTEMYGRSYTRAGHFFACDATFILNKALRDEVSGGGNAHRIMSLDMHRQRQKFKDDLESQGIRGRKAHAVLTELRRTLERAKQSSTTQKQGVDGDTQAMKELECIKAACYVGVIEKVAGGMFWACRAHIFSVVLKTRLALDCFRSVKLPIEAVTTNLHMQLHQLMPWMVERDPPNVGKIFVSYKPDKSEFRYLTGCHSFMGKSLDLVLYNATALGWRAMTQMCKCETESTHRATGHVVTYNQFVTCTSEIVESLPENGSCLSKVDFKARFEGLKHKGNDSISEKSKYFWEHVMLHQQSVSLKSCLFVREDNSKCFWAKPGFRSYAAKKGCHELDVPWLLKAISLELSSSYISLGSSLWVQTLGVFMGRRMSMLHSQVFDWANWHRHMTSCVHAGNAEEAASLRHTYQMADDALNVNCPHFHEVAIGIFRVAESGLHLNEEIMTKGWSSTHGQEVGTEVGMLDIRLSIQQGQISTEPLNKTVLKGRVDNRFVAWELAWVKRRALGVLSSQLTRLTLASNHTAALYPHYLYLVMHMHVKKGYPIDRLGAEMLKFAAGTQHTLVGARTRVHVDTQSAVNDVMRDIEALRPTKRAKLAHTAVAP
jgi:hypothetical protein